MRYSVEGPDERRIEVLRRWATLLDSAFGIPGTHVRFGMDALIGLVPGLGDAVSGLFSAAIIFHATRMGVPRVVLVRMVVNVLIDVLVGAIPVLGDLFDVGWKANLRNVALMERHLVGGRRGAAIGDYFFVGGLAVLLLAAATIPLLVVLALVRALGRPLV
jgi:hypothetical protein